MSKSSDVLTKAATEFAAAKAGEVIGNIGDRASGNKSKPEKKDDNGDDNKGFLGTAAQKMGEGAGPVKSLVSGAGAAIKGIFKRKGGSKRPHNIIEDCYVGVAPDVAFAAWTQFEEFASFTKGVENVTQDEGDEEDEEQEQETGWTAKIWWSRRTWKAKTVDYDPPNRISWTSEGNKGVVDGTITFTAIGENATLMLFVLEYRSKGPIEWIGNRWRTVGRRVRLDIKHFRRYVMRTEPDDLPEPEQGADEDSEDEEFDEADESGDEGSEEGEPEEGGDEEQEESDEDEDDDSESDEEEEQEEESPRRRRREPAGR